jgi:hypothetical protein
MTHPGTSVQASYIVARIRSLSPIGIVLPGTVLDNERFCGGAAIREEWFLSGRLAEVDDNRCGNLVSVDGKSD